MMTSITKQFREKIPKNYRDLSIYTFLNGVQVLLGLIFQVQFARTFGTSPYADVYFVAIAIVTFCLTLGSFFTEMFMQYYNDIKVADSKNAARFYQAVFNSSAVVGFAIFISVLMTFNGVCKLFAPGFDSNRIELLKMFFSVLGVNIVLAGLVSLNSALLFAEMKFMLPYLLGLLTPALNIVSIMMYSGAYGLKAIAMSTLLAGVIITAIQHTYILKMLNISFAPAFWHPDLKKLIRSSFSMRLGHQMWSLKDVVITNVLSRFSVGTVSTYYYAYKVISVLYTITNSPILRIFSAKIARYVSLKDFSSIRRTLKKTFIVNTGLFIVILIPFIFLLPKMLTLLFGSKFSAENIKLIHFIFIALIPFHLIQSVEVLFSNIVIALKQSLKVITINAAFLSIFGVSLLLLVRINGVYAIPISLAIAQLFNLTLYVYGTRRYLNEFVIDVNMQGLD
jgi:peptidoglycan biosynthesis protein MviN/MurJ (putative lipid II flippase)